jgi:hypothetical protein
VKLFRKDLTQEECGQIWLNGKCSIRDVQHAIVNAENEYQSSSKRSKVRVWLARCSARIVYYGNIMDIMVQGCPDYVSFAWGALKFLFTVSPMSISSAWCTKELAG